MIWVRSIKEKSYRRSLIGYTRAAHRQPMRENTLSHKRAPPLRQGTGKPLRRTFRPKCYQSKVHANIQVEQLFLLWSSLAWRASVSIWLLMEPSTLADISDTRCNIY